MTPASWASWLGSGCTQLSPWGAKTLGISMAGIGRFSFSERLLCTDAVLGDVLGFFLHPGLRGRNCHLPLPTDERTETQRVHVVSSRSHSNFWEENRI